VAARDARRYERPVGTADSDLSQYHGHLRAPSGSPCGTQHLRAGADRQRIALDLEAHPADIFAMMAAEVAAGERAGSATIREAGTGMKAAWRL
jgi:hypothetical protein